MDRDIQPIIAKLEAKTRNREVAWEDQWPASLATDFDHVSVVLSPVAEPGESGNSGSDKRTIEFKLINHLGGIADRIQVTSTMPAYAALDRLYHQAYRQVHNPDEAWNLLEEALTS